jgi:hypothetical protein
LSTKPEVSTVLEWLKLDVMQDICGTARPVSGFNYVWATNIMMMHFEMMEEELKRVGNKTYLRAYETDREWRNQKRAGLVFMAMRDGDEECLRVMAGVLEKAMVGFMNHVYWDELKDTLDVLWGKITQVEELEPDRCVVM